MRTYVFLAVAFSMSSHCYARPLTNADEIRRAVLGNTISGIENGVAYEEYFERDGFVRGREASGFYTGEWRIAAQELCMRYFNDDAVPEDSEDVKGVPGDWECSGIDVDGSNLTFTSGGERFAATLKQGNPGKL